MQPALQRGGSTMVSHSLASRAPLKDRLNLTFCWAAAGPHDVLVYMRDTTKWQAVKLNLPSFIVFFSNRLFLERHYHSRMRWMLPTQTQCDRRNVCHVLVLTQTFNSWVHFSAISYLVAMDPYRRRDCNFEIKPRSKCSVKLDAACCVE